MNGKIDAGGGIGLQRRRHNRGKGIILCLLLAIFLFTVMAPAYAQDKVFEDTESHRARAAIEEWSAMQELQGTVLGSQSPDSLVKMETFLQAAVPYLTFEQGEDPLYIAKKQGYIKGDPAGFADRDEVLYALMKMTCVDIPAGGDLGQIARKYGIIPDQDKTMPQGNRKITVADACRLIVNARSSWYERLVAEEAAEELDLLGFYLSNSMYSYPEFTFSGDARVLWYNEMDGPRAINVADQTPSGRPPEKAAPRQEYPAAAGEEVINCYDNAGVLRAVSIEVSKRTNYVTDKYILYRASTKQPWRRLVEFDLSLTRDYEIAGFTPDNKKMLVKTNFYDNYVTLYELDPETMSRRAIYRNAHADVAAGLVSILTGIPGPGLKDPQTGELLTVVYVDDKIRLVCLNNAIAKIMEQVGSDLGENQFPVAVSPGFSHMVLLHRDDRDYGSYRLYDVKNRSSALLLSSAIPQKDVGRTFPVSFKAGDGHTVFGYLTLPPGKSPQNIPLMIYPHGGPQARFMWTPFEHALLASNLGIAVLSIDFRFSIGYGNEYTDMGSKNMSLAQQDVFESAMWAIRNGIADPKGVGIMGHSYGGYSAFYQTAVHPEIYKAAISLMGIWDWTDLGVELVGEEPVPDYHKCSAPMPHSELAAALSPSSYTENLKCPIFIIYTGKDDSVYPSQGVRAVQDLTEAGNIPEVLYLPHIGHNPDTVESITNVFERMKGFITKHMLRADVSKTSENWSFFSGIGLLAGFVSRFVSSKAI